MNGSVEHPAPEVAELEYGVQPTGGRRRRWAWVVFRWGAVVGALGVAVASGPRVARQWEVLRVQGACLRAELPADRPVYDEDYLHHAALTARFPREYDYDASDHLRRVDARWTAMEKLLPPRGVVARGGASFVPYSRPGTAFLHERFTPSGRRRLVVVELSGLDAGVTVIEPADWLTPPRLIARGAFDLDDMASRALEGLWRRIGRRVQYSAGGADPSDRSRFTVVMTLGGVSGTIDCRLGDDDRVTVALRDPGAFAVRVLAALELGEHDPVPADAAGVQARLDARLSPMAPLFVDAPPGNGHVVALDGGPLSDALEAIRDYSPINVCVNWGSLRAVGIGPETPVTFRLVRPTVRAMLEAALARVRSGGGAAQYAVEDNVVVVWAANAPRPTVVASVPPGIDREIPEVNLTAQPFDDVITYLGDVGGVRIRADYGALGAAGIRPDSEVTMRLRGLRLSKVVKFVLMGTAGDARVPLKCVDEGNGLVITTGGRR